ncbi:MAG: HlyD family efflux transporter periplasmic adaptor subunit [Clostridia bacterium]
MKTKKKIATIITLLILAATIGVGVYFIVKNLTKEQLPDGSEGMLYRGYIESSVTGSGRTVAQKHEKLGTELKGEVWDVYVKTGDTVSVGDLLLSVNPEDIREDLNDALDVYDDALLSVNTIQTKINNLSVKAPFTGKIVSVTEQSEGTYVSEESVFATIVDDSTMKLSAYFSYGYIDQIKVGQQALVSIPATTSNLTGTVSNVENVKKITTDGAILFKVDISIENPGTLTKDMIATAVITTDLGDVMPAEYGTLDYNRTQDIILKASGELISKNVNEFYTYNVGTVLGVIQNESLANELASANRTLTSAQETVDDINELLVQTELRSPIDGMVSQVSAVIGDELDASTTPISISNLQTLKIDAEISEIDITKVQMGMPVNITYEATDGMYSLMGEITSLSFEASTNNDMYSSLTKFPCTITIFDPQDLRPDMNVQYSISASVIDNALLAPVSAVVQTDIGPSIYIKPEYAEGFETFPITDERIPEGYVAVAVEVGISDGYNSQILTEIPENAEIYMPNSSLMQQGFDQYGGYGETYYYG